MGDPKRCNAPPTSHGQVDATTKKKIKLFEVELADESGKVMPNVEYKITFGEGVLAVVREGKTDQKGIGSHSDVPEKEMQKDKDFELSIKGSGAEKNLKKPPEIKPNVAKIERCQSIIFTFENLPQKSSIRNWVFYGGTETEKIEVKREKGEKPDTWQKSWEGQIVTSGKIFVHHQIREQVCDSDAKVVWRITPYAPVEYKMEVVPRTKGWSPSTVTREKEKPTSQMPNSLLVGSTRPNVPPVEFPDLGRHAPGGISWRNIDDPKTVPSGPNKGYSFLDTFKLSKIVSHAFINDDLLNKKSPFAKAQDGKVYATFEGEPGRKLVDSADVTIQGGVAKPNDKDAFNTKYHPVYLVQPEPRRRLKKGEYTISGETITLKDELQFYKSYKIPVTVDGNAISPKDWKIENGKWAPAPNDKVFRKKYGDYAKVEFEAYQLEMVTGKYDVIIKYDDLLSFTRRHEYVGDPDSHRANFEKVIRALDPTVYMEGLTAKPGEPDPKQYFETKIKERATEILSVETGEDLHKMVDEDETKKAQAIKYFTIPKAGAGGISGCNIDDAGANAGNVWDPKNKKAFETSGY